VTSAKSPIAIAWDAIESGDVDDVRDVFARFPSLVNYYIPFGGGTFLHLAASMRGRDVIHAMIDMGFDPSKRSQTESHTPLSTAASYGNFEAASALLDRGARIDVDNSIANPLFSAIVGRSLEIAKLLLQAGIDPRVKYDGTVSNNFDAIAFAIERGEKEIATFVAEWISEGDRSVALELLNEADRIARGIPRTVYLFDVPSR
jgi:uncharacterized protein